MPEFSELYKNPKYYSKYSDKEISEHIYNELTDYGNKELDKNKYDYYVNASRDNRALLAPDSRQDVPTQKQKQGIPAEPPKTSLGFKVGNALMSLSGMAEDSGIGYRASDIPALSKERNEQLAEGNVEYGPDGRVLAKPGMGSGLSGLRAMLSAAAQSTPLSLMGAPLQGEENKQQFVDYWTPKIGEKLTAGLGTAGEMLTPIDPVVPTAKGFKTLGGTVLGGVKYPLSRLGELTGRAAKTKWVGENTKLGEAFSRGAAESGYEIKKDAKEIGGNILGALKGSGAEIKGYPRRIREGVKDIKSIFTGKKSPEIVGDMNSAPGELSGTGKVELPNPEFPGRESGDMQFGKFPDKPNPQDIINDIPETVGAEGTRSGMGFPEQVRNTGIFDRKQPVSDIVQDSRTPRQIYEDSKVYPDTRIAEPYKKSIVSENVGMPARDRMRLEATGSTESGAVPFRDVQETAKAELAANDLKAMDNWGATEVGKANSGEVFGAGGRKVNPVAPPPPVATEPVAPADRKTPGIIKRIFSKRAEKTAPKPGDAVKNFEATKEQDMAKSAVSVSGLVDAAASKINRATSSKENQKLQQVRTPKLIRPPKIKSDSASLRPKLVGSRGEPVQYFEGGPSKLSKKFSQDMAPIKEKVEPGLKQARKDMQELIDKNPDKEYHIESVKENGKWTHNIIDTPKVVAKEVPVGNPVFNKFLDRFKEMSESSTKKQKEEREILSRFKRDESGNIKVSKANRKLFNPDNSPTAEEIAWRKANGWYD